MATCCFWSKMGPEKEGSPAGASPAARACLLTCLLPPAAPSIQSRCSSTATARAAWSARQRCSRGGCGSTCRWGLAGCVKMRPTSSTLGALTSKMPATPMPGTPTARGSSPAGAHWPSGSRAATLRSGSEGAGIAAGPAPGPTCEEAAAPRRVEGEPAGRAARSCRRQAVAVHHTSSALNDCLPLEIPFYSG